ncbi:hypothetical protein VIGAN_10230600 [Vigna angularis var. angularis]|uniref:Uncharacterized protein n=1 Tax=Vigna angularis var. angularis TaxID=157739 RepID=A0A0S3T6X7_PHAAN|nr:hypothetical protein VIGAN_10230600 [Vigna angularis var. angularis]
MKLTEKEESLLRIPFCEHRNKCSPRHNIQLATCIMEDPITVRNGSSKICVGFYQCSYHFNFCNKTAFNSQTVQLKTFPEIHVNVVNSTTLIQ